MKSKYISLLLLAGAGSNYAVASNSDDVYSDSLYIQRSSAEIPSSFESSARGNYAEVDEPDAGTEKVLESLSELDEDAAPIKAVATAKNSKKKKSSRN